MGYRCISTSLLINNIEVTRYPPSRLRSLLSDIINSIRGSLRVHEPLVVEPCASTQERHRPGWGACNYPRRPSILGSAMVRPSVCEGRRWCAGIGKLHAGACHDSCLMLECDTQAMTGTVDVVARMRAGNSLLLPPTAPMGSSCTSAVVVICRCIAMLGESFCLRALPCGCG